MENIKWWEEQKRLWNELVPPRGQADTVQGELIRCTGKLADEAYNNQNKNWDSGYELLARYVGDKLNDPNTFSPEELEKIKESIEEIIRNHKTPDISGHGSAYYFLTEMAVEWCLSNLDPIPNEKNPDITI